MAYKTREELAKELAMLRALKQKQNNELKAKRDVLSEFKKMDRERRSLKKEVFALKHPKKVATIKTIGVVSKSVGSEIGRGLRAYHLSQQKKNKKATRRR